MYKKFVVLALAAVVLSGCGTRYENIGIGAGVGAVGAALVGGSALTGAAVGVGVVVACEEGYIC